MSSARSAPETCAGVGGVNYRLCQLHFFLTKQKRDPKAFVLENGTRSSRISSILDFRRLPTRSESMRIKRILAARVSSDLLLHPTAFIHLPRVDS
jgi:hypothetical protein